MFGFLELTDRSDYNPHEFCFSFKDGGGNPVNVSVQQDTQEFLNMIFDKLERGLKHTPFRAITNSVYGGKTSNLIICEGCGHVRDNVEDFFNMSVEVKNMKTVYDSFDKYIQGETIEGFFCENCKKTNNITKRAALKHLPNVLIVHLQRIVFDFETLMLQKINSRLEFPTELNMEPYTNEGLEWRTKQKSNEKKAKKEGTAEKAPVEKEEKGGMDSEEGKTEIEKEKPKEVDEEELGPYKLHPKEYYQYKLAGVVVHVGSAEGGHYYSYISTNRGDPSKSDPSKADKWLEFNDSNIRDFDTKNIESECFGGASNEKEDDSSWGWVKAGRENSKSAYILVYERVVKDPLKLVARTKDDETYLNRVLDAEKLISQNPESLKIVEEELTEGDNKLMVKNYFVDYYSLKRFIPSKVYQKVWEDNHKFMFERHIYTEDYFKFIKDVCNTLIALNPQNEPKLASNLEKMANFLTFLIIYILARASDNKGLADIATTLKIIISLVPSCADKIFDNFFARDIQVFEIWLKSPEESVRGQIGQLTLYLINTMISHHKLELNDVILTEEQIASLSEEERRKVQAELQIQRFLQHAAAIMPNEVAQAWLKMGQYFEFWRDFANSGEAQVNYLYKREFIAVLIDFYLEKRSPLKDFSEKKHSIGNRFADPEYKPLVQTIAILVRRAKTQTKDQPPTSVAYQGLKTYDISENDSSCLFCPEFYIKTMQIKDKFDPQAYGVIIQHLSFDNFQYSNSLCNIILQGMSKATTSDEYKPYIESITALLNIQDDLQMKRIEWLLGYPQPAKVMGHRGGADSFGLYGNTSLEDNTITYESTADGENSMITVMLQNRKRFENITLTCLKQLMLLAEVNPVVFEYIFTLPPPSYMYAKFIDWMPGFIDYYIADAKKYYYTSSNKEEAGQDAMKQYKILEERVEKRIQMNKQLMVDMGLKTEDDLKDEEKDKENKVYSSFFKPYIIGQTFKEEEIDCKTYTFQDQPFRVSLNVIQTYAYIIDSKPNGKTNFALPQYLLSDVSRMKNADVPNNSPVGFFIQPKASSYARFQNHSLNDIHPVHPNHNEIETILRKQKNSEQTTTEIQKSNGGPAQNLEEKKGGEESKGETKVKVDDKFYVFETDSPSAEDFNMTYEVNPVLRRFQVQNDSPYSFLTQLMIVPKSSDFMNFRIPTSVFKTHVKPKSTTNLLVLMKIFPEMGWGDYDYQFNIEREDK